MKLSHLIAFLTEVVLGF